ncbi:hypothetical protein OM409_23980 [Serratia bockelmannii]|uniref:hypothetical protein n=1 Tax=Serratia bockelmannii TaxID=2703793 RepID=UPI00223FBC8F|nr:hypothetical protein [Serratia bockelmannii]MCW7650489.1 hypothetical protein [Serratia bockelmannii]MCW7660357.1 hypothetical protein [Serratia bockelmannii]MCW7680058.1 hypothetical protein [Serratia bockelmannii]MCW7684835.1 hypothetical protein [Serratia bockelmannii]MCW7689612.1 hypothetical protein [Serratia bockelmannii]
MMKKQICLRKKERNTLDAHKEAPERVDLGITQANKNTEDFKSDYFVFNGIEHFDFSVKKYRGVFAKGTNTAPPVRNALKSKFDKPSVSKDISANELDNVDSNDIVTKNGENYIPFEKDRLDNGVTGTGKLNFSNKKNEFYFNNSKWNIDKKKNNYQEDVVTINHSELPENTILSQVSMLGSHDAGTYAYTSYKSMGGLLPFAFKTQCITLLEQARAGVRYFDIRIAMKKNASFGFFHGQSISEGDAISDVIALLEYAKNDPKNFYLMKFHFKNEISAPGNITTSSDIFLKRALKDCRDNLITKSDTQNLAMITINLLGKNKNIAVMVKNYHGTEQHWLYDEQVHTKWANKADAQKTAKFIREFYKTVPPKDKLIIIQTNMPFLSVNSLDVTRGVKSYLSEKSDIIASAVDEIPYPGIISGDYIGYKKSATNRFKTKIESNNEKLLRKP